MAGGGSKFPRLSQWHPSGSDTGNIMHWLGLRDVLPNDRHEETKTTKPNKPDGEGNCRGVKQEKFERWVPK